MAICHHLSSLHHKRSWPAITQWGGAPAASEGPHGHGALGGRVGQAPCALCRGRAGLGAAWRLGCRVEQGHRTLRRGNTEHQKEERLRRRWREAGASAGRQGRRVMQGASLCWGRDIDEAGRSRARMNGWWEAYRIGWWEEKKSETNKFRRYSKGPAAVRFFSLHCQNQAQEVILVVWLEMFLEFLTHCRSKQISFYTSQHLY